MYSGNLPPSVADNMTAAIITDSIPKSRYFMGILYLAQDVTIPFTKSDHITEKQQAVGRLLAISGKVKFFKEERTCPSFLVHKLNNLF
jgi:hypothetical protein